MKERESKRINKEFPF